MKIIVCIKQVPAKDSTLRIAEGGAWIRDSDISFEINEPDAYALEAALRLKEQHGGEVVAMSAGPGRVQTVLREALAGLPHSTITMDVQPQTPQVQGSGRLRVKRELEAGWFQWVDMPMPAVLSIQSGLAKLRYATLMGIKKAKTKEIKRLTKAELGWNDADWAPTQVVRRVYVPQKSKQTQFIEGTAKEAAAKLVEKLRFEARVI
jgi:electron transfer flavoprotein beta subunit